MRLLLLGDIHAHRLQVPPWHLAGKALFGQLNLWLRRRQKFNLALLPATVERAAALRPDLVLLTGDLTTTAFRGEFADVAAALAPLLAAAPTVAVPGNHDRYTLTSTLRHAFEHALPGIVPPHFPFLRPLRDILRLGVGDLPSPGGGRWHLLALHTARPTLCTSRGRLGRRQLAATRAAVAGLSPSDALLVICHYALGKPPQLHPSPWQHLLGDADALRALLAEFPGRIIFMHGHIHRPWLWRRPEPTLSRVIDLNAGAPCYVAPGFPLGQGFWEIELSPRVDAPIEFRHHQLVPQAMAPAPVDAAAIPAPAPAPGRAIATHKLQIPNPKSQIPNFKFPISVAPAPNSDAPAWRVERIGIESSAS